MLDMPFLFVVPFQVVFFFLFRVNILNSKMVAIELQVFKTFKKSLFYVYGWLFGLWVSPICLLLQRPEEGIKSLKQKLQMVVSFHLDKEIKPRSS